MKKRIAILLLAAFLFNVIASHFILPFLLDSYKGRFGKGKKDKMVTHVITIGLSDRAKINFIHSKEFIYEGKLFDILDKKVEKGKTVYYCYHDKEEEKAAKNHKENQSKKNSINLTGLFNILFINSTALNIYPAERLNEYFFEDSLYKSHSEEVPAPPPNV